MKLEIFSQYHVWKWFYRLLQGATEMSHYEYSSDNFYVSICICPAKAKQYRPYTFCRRKLHASKFNWPSVRGYDRKHPPPLFFLVDAALLFHSDSVTAIIILQADRPATCTSTCASPAQYNLVCKPTSVWFMCDEEPAAPLRQLSFAN